MHCVLLGCSFIKQFQTQVNSRALGTVMTIGLAINRCLRLQKPVWREQTRLTSSEGQAEALIAGCFLVEWINVYILLSERIGFCSVVVHKIIRLFSVLLIFLQWPISGILSWFVKFFEQQECERKSGSGGLCIRSSTRTKTEKSHQPCSDLWRGKCVSSRRKACQTFCNSWSRY